MNVEAIISTCQALAAQQYPQDDSERWKYLSELLATKLREIAYTSQNLRGKVETGNSSLAGGITSKTVYSELMLIRQDLKQAVWKKSLD